MNRLLLILSLPAAAVAQSGGPWTVISSTLDSGGTVSTGGAWKVTGTIGQPDAAAAASAGGAWLVQGGFWPGTVVEPGGPLLTLAPLGVTSVSVGWTAAATGYKLQYSQNLASWTDYPGLTISGASSVAWPLLNGPRYYFRLTKLP
jgi:hypothetical protein